MTQAIQATTTDAAVSETLDNAPLFLFEVTLDWNSSNSDEGDYSANVWARDEDHAVRLLAEEMADHKHSYCDTDEERARFVERRIENAASHAAIRVASTVLSDCKDLLEGPNEELTADAAADYATIAAILKKYGAQ